MTADPLEQILRLVAEGRLTADEAAPILAALDERKASEGAPGRPPGGFGPNPPPGSTRGGDRAGVRTGAGARTDRATGSTTLRIEVLDRGRQVVNVRLPIAVGKLALDRVPGLSGDQVSRVREALNSGFTGSLLEVDDDGDGVRIVLE